MFSKGKQANLAPSKTTACQFYITVYVVIKQIQYGVNPELAFRSTGRIPIGLMSGQMMKNEKRKTSAPPPALT